MSRKNINLIRVRGWRKEYMVRRYMEFLSKDQLKKRYEDIRFNIKMLSGQQSFKVDFTILFFSEEEYFVRAFVHIIQELRLKGIKTNTFERKKPKYAMDYQEALIAFEAGRYQNKTIQSLNNIKQPNFLVRYSKYEYLKDLLYNGNLIIRPASYYNFGDELTTTQTDNELEVSYEQHPSSVEITHLKTGKTIKPIGNIKIKKKLVVDYWLYSMSTVFDIRLFNEYCADSCIIIKNPSEFMKRIEKAFKLATAIPFECTNKIVNYIDDQDTGIPLGSNSDDVCFSKSIKYYYEKEYRMTWISRIIPFGKIEDGQLHINVGPVNDICELIKIRRIG